MLKIQRSTNRKVVFTLSGRIEAEDVKKLQQLLALETAGQRLVLDLRDVTLVNQAPWNVSEALSESGSSG